MKLLSWIFTTFLFTSKMLAADWIAYSTDVSNFQIIPFNVMTEVGGAPISSARCVGLAITPDASTAYVINRNVLNTISVVDLNTQTIVNTISLNAGGIDQQPFSIAITPDGTAAYITALDSSNNATLLHLDLSLNTYSVIPIVPNVQSDSVAISPDGTMLYLTQTSAVVGMTIPGNVFSTPLNLPGRSTRIVSAPDGQHLYVSDMINNQLFEIDVLAQVISQTIPLTASSQPTNLAISADGEWIYIANENANFCTAVDLLNSYAVTDILLGALPSNYTQQGVAISPDSQKALFTHSGLGQISTVTVGSTTVNNSSVVGNPAAIAITPDQAPIASFNSTISPPFSPSVFTSTSTTLVGSIMSYLWDFGDGNTVSTNVNPVQHTYTSGGSYNVTLTVINSGGTSTEQTFTGQTVSNNGGPSATITSVINVPFLVPIVNSVSPSIGSSGTVVNISGVNFTGATAVFFGTTPASFTVQNDSLIIATAPNGVQGVVSITVTTPGGTSGVSSSSEFTYQSENILPPIFLKGEQKGNKFLTQTEYVNTIEWRAPQTGISPVAYRIYTDPLLTNLIANIPALSEVQAYSIHNQKKGSSTYYMISVGSSGEVSTSTPMVVL